MLCCGSNIRQYNRVVRFDSLKKNVEETNRCNLFQFHGNIYQ